MNKKRYATIAILATLAAVCITSVSRRRNVHYVSVHTPSVIARHQVEAIGLSIWAHRMESGRFPVHTNSVDYMAATLRELSKSDEWTYRRERGLSTNTWVWLDPWGTPYDVEIIGITADTNEFRNIFGADIWGRVWSHGQNKINEYGEGDDIKNDF